MPFDSSDYSLSDAEATLDQDEIVRGMALEGSIAEDEDDAGYELN